MAQQALPPGVTALSARATPRFSGAALRAPSTSNFDSFSTYWAQMALAQDPRSVIAEVDVYALRVWVKSLLGNSWRDDLTIDDVMKMNPRILYKAACLYLQGQYWGALPDDWTGESSAAPSTLITHEGGGAFVGSPALDWPNGNSTSEQRIFKWRMRMLPIAAPGMLAEDVNGAIYMPIIAPSLLVQKFDASFGGWRVLNLGGTDRDFMLDAPGGAWRMKGWDFGEWLAANATFMEILKVVGIIVVAAAAAITGGAALVGGAGIGAALSAGFAGAQAAQQIVGAAENFLQASISGNPGQMLNALSGLVKTSFGIDLTSVASYQPGINQLGATFDQAIGPYVKMLKSGLGTDTIGDVYRTIIETGRTAEAYAAQADKLLTQLSIDAARAVSGLPPDLLLKSLATAKTNEVIALATKLKADYTQRANAAIDGVKNQVPLFLNDWKEKGRSMVQQIGKEAAIANAATVPWFGKTAYNAGTLIGAFEANMSLQTAPDLMVLSAAQKRSLFFGDIASVCGSDPNCLINAAEFLRQSDGFWQSIQGYADYYKLRK